jgi:hypothetical protein
MSLWQITRDACLPVEAIAQRVRAFCSHAATIGAAGRPQRKARHTSPTAQSKPDGTCGGVRL